MSWSVGRLVVSILDFLFPQLCFRGVRFHSILLSDSARSPRLAGQLGSSVQVDALWTLALLSNLRSPHKNLRIQGVGELIPKLASGLFSSRKQGRWGNTQENVFAVLAIRAYVT